MLNVNLTKFNKLLLVLFCLLLCVGAAVAYLHSLRVTTNVYALNAQEPRRAPFCNETRLDKVQPILSARPLTSPIKFLVWNVYKYQDPSWQETLTELINSKDLVLLQEASNVQRVSQFWQQHGWNGFGVSAFSQGGDVFGVQNLAKVAGQLMCVGLNSEPWLQIPKSSLVTLYPIASSSNGLLVINVHGINFSFGTEDWNLQLAPLFALVEQHSGPIIFAGDFNTWSEERQTELQIQAIAAGLSEVRFQPDHRLQVLGQTLDHIYVKGMTIDSAETRPWAGSDHFPMEVVASF